MHVVMDWPVRSAAPPPRPAAGSHPFYRSLAAVRKVVTRPGFIAFVSGPSGPGVAAGTDDSFLVVPARHEATGALPPSREISEDRFELRAGNRCAAVSLDTDGGDRRHRRGGGNAA